MDYEKNDSEKQVRVTKLIYWIVISVLCTAAIVTGIVIAANRKNTNLPTADDAQKQADGKTDTSDIKTPDTEQENKEPESKEPEEKKDEPKVTTYVAPTVGTVMREHSMTVPVFSPTLEEWRVHTGIDIAADEGTAIYAAADGIISAVYSDPLFGNTVVVKHSETVKTVYSNLAPEGLPTVGLTVKVGDKIGAIGDSSISELADEPHLHFEMKVNDVPVNPLDYLSEASKKASLGIGKEEIDKSKSA